LFLCLAIFAGWTTGCGSPAGSGEEKPQPSAAAPSDAAHSDGDGHDHGAHSDEHAGEAKLGETEHAEGEVKLTADQEKIAGIQVEAVGNRVVQQTLDLPGVISSTTQGRAMVTPPIAGRVLSIGIHLGQMVQRGQVLATIESPELAQSWSNIAEAERVRESAISSLQESKSEVGLAAAKLSAAQTNLQRQTALAKAGAFSQAPVQQAQSELNDAQSDLLSLQKEQASHAEVVRRLENLYRDGIVSRSELEAARLELQQDQIRLERANARVANAKATYERERNIASRGLLNAKELQSADAEVRSARLELERARIRVRSAEATVASAGRAVVNARATYKSNAAGSGASGDRVFLKAPISGTVTRLDITTGQAVDRTQVLMEIEDLSRVWVTASVPERELSKVRLGAKVRISPEATPNREFDGVVEIVGGRVDPKTRTIPVQCSVTNANGLLKPAMFAKVHLAYGKDGQALAVPSSAVLTEGGTSFVFVQHDDGYLKTEVQLGQRAAGYTSVLAGLKAGDRVVSQGAFVLLTELKKDELKGHEH
jgi:cobalt-zinc-cadmium efflux system membrane fusion protein